MVEIELWSIYLLVKNFIEENLIMFGISLLFLVVVGFLIARKKSVVIEKMFSEEDFLKILDVFNSSYDEKWKSEVLIKVARQTKFEGNGR